MEQQMFNNSSILAWLTYYAEHTQVYLRKVKILDITRKNKNVIPTVESHNTACGLQALASAASGTTKAAIPPDRSTTNRCGR